VYCKTHYLVSGYDMMLFLLNMNKLNVVLYRFAEAFLLGLVYRFFKYFNFSCHIKCTIFNLKCDLLFFCAPVYSPESAMKRLPHKHYVCCVYLNSPQKIYSGNACYHSVQSLLSSQCELKFSRRNYSEVQFYLLFYIKKNISLAHSRIG